MKAKLRLCVNTQTPLVRFKTGYSELRERFGYRTGPIDLRKLKLGLDYDFTPGGVTGMVESALERMMASKAVVRPNWIALGPGAPREVQYGAIRLHNVSLDEEQLSLYAEFKEGIWKEIHGLGRLAFKPKEYQAYVEYNYRSARMMLEMLDDTDLFWVHDFQQLYTGGLIGPSAPAVFRWHIPFRLQEVSLRLRTLVLKSIESFDSIIVSTKRDLEGLIRTGYGGQVHTIYPYLDPTEWSKTPRRRSDAVRDKFDIRSDDRVLLVVGRMDPVKSQDVAVEALSSIAKEFPSAKLVLVGNGSFTGSAAGGLGHPKARKWHSHLRTEVERLKLGGRVVFTGHVSREELHALYSMAEAVLVPSNIEGFNLTAVEGWLNKKPCVVSRGAGVSELVHDGLNGYTFVPGDHSDLAEKIRTVLKSSEAAAKVGENGLMTAKLCSIDVAVDALMEAFESALKLY
jgi:glycosyltransferase involved in cell wall biosynthesis